MISVILVNYNGAEDTIECIRSINRSIGIEYRIIVVDNCSTDDSVEKLNYVQTIDNFILLKTFQNRGFSAGNNIGIRKAIEMGTDYVLLLNNDTLIENNTLQYLIQGLKEYEGCGLTIGKIYYESNRNLIWYAGGTFNKTIAKASHWNYKKLDGLTSEQDKEVTFSTGCCMCVPINVIRDVGLLDEDYFLYEEDADYCLRIRQSGYKMMYIPKAVVYHKVSASTGKMTGIIEYYTFRNKCMLIKKQLCGKEKIQAYAYTVLCGLYNCIKGEQHLHILLKAMKAFRNGEIGKTERDI